MEREREREKVLFIKSSGISSLQALIIYKNKKKTIYKENTKFYRREAKIQKYKNKQKKFKNYIQRLKQNRNKNYKNVKKKT